MSPRSATRRVATPDALNYVFADEAAGVYKKLVVKGKHLLGAILVGDASDYGPLLQLALNGVALPEHPENLILPARIGGGKGIGVDALPDAALVCSCNSVSKGAICEAVEGRLHDARCAEKGDEVLAQVIRDGDALLPHSASMTIFASGRSRRAPWRTSSPFQRTERRAADLHGLADGAFGNAVARSTRARRRAARRRDCLLPPPMRAGRIRFSGCSGSATPFSASCSSGP